VSVSHARTPISVIVPCFNEEDGIPFLANNLASLKNDLANQFDTEFVLVDDGSKDQTWTLLQKHFSDNPDAKLIRHPQNRGVSAAIMTGLQHSREIACSIDCDCSYDPGELRPMLRLLTSEVDLVTASPYHPAGTVLNVPGWRLLLSRTSSALYRAVTNHKLHTFTACVRVYRRSAAVDIPLKYTGFLGVAELLGKMALANKRIVEHPATLEVRIFGQSKMRVLQTIMGHLKLLSELGWMRLTTPDSGQKASEALDSVVRFPIAETVEAKVEKG
jgi:glycosyltransferase involved in cell wall biosynthesis